MACKNPNIWLFSRKNDAVLCCKTSDEIFQNYIVPLIKQKMHIPALGIAKLVRKSAEILKNQLKNKKNKLKI